MTEKFDVQQDPTLGSTGSITTSVPATSGAGVGPTSVGPSTKDAAKEGVRDVAQDGVQGGKHVASVAADQAKEVVSEAGSQAQALLAEAKSELLEQASSQKNRVTEQLNTLAQELGSMASSSDQNGLASDLAGQASRQVGAIANWVSEREPGSLVGELKDFARAKPGTFLVVAAGIGLAAGRLTRGVKAGVPQENSSSAPPATATIPAAVSPVGLAQPEPMPSSTEGYGDPLPAGPPVRVGGSYTPGAIEEPFAPGAPGLPR